MTAVADRFWSKVVQDPGGDCWLWTGAPDRDGYSRFRLPDRTVKAHRWAYEYLVSEIPVGLMIDHLCRNRACVNPGHMEPVTNQVNQLRGQGFPAANAAKTTCLLGHPFAGANLYVRPDGERLCRECHRRRTRETRQRQMERAAS